jgi:hypothetical protein
MAGIADTHVIDLVATDADGNAEVWITEDDPWTKEPEQNLHLREKFNTYVTYILEGMLIRDYPTLADHSVTLKLLCNGEPPAGEITETIETARAYLEKYDVSVVVQRHT